MICPEYIDDGEFCLRCQYHATDHKENKICNDGWAICMDFMRVDDEDNFDVCSNCQAHRLDHTEVI
jgi:hypothetical protein